MKIFRGKSFTFVLSLGILLVLLGLSRGFYNFALLTVGFAFIALALLSYKTTDTDAE